MMRFNALILAGTRPEGDAVASYAGVAEKALVEICGFTMLARVVTALRAAGAARIAVSASTDDVREHAVNLGTEPLTAAAGPSSSALDGLARLGVPLLVTTADHALLRPEWIQQLLAEMPCDADIGLLLARRDVIEKAVPETRRTYLRFADGAWSGCNLFFFATPRGGEAVAIWQNMEGDRKKPWRLMRRLGLRFLMRYLAAQLTLDDALERLGTLGRVRIRYVASRDGLAAVDVDKPDDLALARRLLAASATAVNRFGPPC